MRIMDCVELRHARCPVDALIMVVQVATAPLADRHRAEFDERLLKPQRCRMPRRKTKSSTKRAQYKGPKI